jgi:hypothetical protein
MRSTDVFLFRAQAWGLKEGKEGFDNPQAAG